MDVLLAIADDDLREALTFVLEDAGCEVTAMNRRLTVVTGQPWSTPSVIVVLDAHLDEAVMRDEVVPGHLLNLFDRLRNQRCSATQKR